MDKELKRLHRRIDKNTITGNKELTEVFVQECQIEFQIGENITGITKIVEIMDCYDQESDFKQSLKNDDTIKDYFYYGKYKFEDIKYDVYQIFFNDCEECDSVFIGLREVIEMFNFKYKSPNITGIKFSNIIPVYKYNNLVILRYSIVKAIKQLENYKCHKFMWWKYFNNKKYYMFSVTFTNGTKSYIGVRQYKKGEQND